MKVVPSTPIYGEYKQLVHRHVKNLYDLRRALELYCEQERVLNILRKLKI